MISMHTVVLARLKAMQSELVNYAGETASKELASRLSKATEALELACNQIVIDGCNDKQI